MRFLLRMRGALIAAPRIDAPVMKMPHAAPMTHSVSASALPNPAKAKGSTDCSSEDQFAFEIGDGLGLVADDMAERKTVLKSLA